MIFGTVQESTNNNNNNNLRKQTSENNYSISVSRIEAESEKINKNAVADQINLPSSFIG